MTWGSFGSRHSKTPAGWTRTCIMLKTPMCLITFHSERVIWWPRYEKKWCMALPVHALEWSCCSSEKRRYFFTATLKKITLNNNVLSLKSSLTNTYFAPLLKTGKLLRRWPKQWKIRRSLKREAKCGMKYVLWIESLKTLSIIFKD